MTNKDRVNILLVDDQPANLLVMQTVLGVLDENLICANSGEEALRAVLQMDFAVILLDVRMPTMSGFETARLIRSRSRSSRVAILFITASFDASFPIEEAYELGAVDYLTKPILPTVLRAKVAFFVDLYRKTEELANVERARHAVALNAKDERIRLGEERFSLIVNSSGEGIFGVGLDARCMFLNTAGAAMLGYEPGELIGRPIHEIIHHQSDGTFYPIENSPIGKAAREGVALRIHDEIFWRKDGTTVPVSYSVSPIVVDGKTEGAVVTFTDITERKRAEDELRRVAAELAEADRRKTEFLATLAHELRNPLAPLRNGLQVMRLAASDPAAVTRAREIMERQLSLMVRLVNDLLDVARITRGNVELKKENVDLASIVNSAIETSLPLIEAAHHVFTVNIPEEPVSLWVDPTRIAQVIGNLLNNAAKYTPSGGRIELSARLTEEALLIISVTDTGAGIAAESLDVVFDMFTQLKQGKDRAQGGLGIGLTLVRRLVALHGGTVIAASPGLGQGSTFTVSLPLFNTDDSVPLMMNTPTVENSGNTLPAFRVLVIDDNVDAADTLATMLEIIGHKTAVANNGYQALEVAQAFNPEVVFLDIGMPGMNGYEVARALRKIPGLEKIVLVALTGWGTDNDRAQSKEAGFDQHLTKPIGLANVTDLFSNLVN